MNQSHSGTQDFSNIHGWQDSVLQKYWFYLKFSINSKESYLKPQHLFLGKLNHHFQNSLEMQVAKSRQALLKNEVQKFAPLGNETYL